MEKTNNIVLLATYLSKFTYNTQFGTVR